MHRAGRPHVPDQRRDDDSASGDDYSSGADDDRLEGGHRDPRPNYDDQARGDYYLDDGYDYDDGGSPATTTTTTLPPTTTVLHQLLQKPTVPQFTLGQLVDYFFAEADRAWALKVALCESSGLPDHVSSDAVHPSSRASGWFQHLPKFWQERSEAAGFAGVDILDPVANVGVAAWLMYDGGGKRHWDESKVCWR